VARAKATRRRGDELEAAILDAAWTELLEVGPNKLTMESVASRARTGVAVLYRRWANKDDLVIAAIRRYSELHPVAIPDTGNLRDDLRGLLQNFTDERFELITIFTALLAGLRDSAGRSPAELREAVLGGAPLRSDVILQRAHDRGEIDLARVSMDIRELPFQLIRHDMLMTLEPLPPERIRTIVDDIYWPLIRTSVEG
jgi:AcrR family transcriptional regulator